MAAFLSTNFGLPPDKQTGKSRADWRAVLASRELFKDSLDALRNVLKRIGRHDNIDVLVESLKNSSSQYKAFKNLIIHVYPGIEADARSIRAIDAIEKASLKFGYEQDFYRAYRRAYRNIFGVYATARRAGDLLAHIADRCHLPLEQIHREEVKRAITFPPEFKQAGIGILSYFSEIVNFKYPDMRVGITIVQEGHKVILIVDTPEGTKEQIEQELHDYGLVVTGSLSPDGYLRDHYQVLALKHKLEITNLELRHTRELLFSERSNLGNRIRSLEEQTQSLYAMLDKDRYHSTELAAQLRDLASSATVTAEAAVKGLISTVEKAINVQNSSQEFEKHLAEIKKQDPNLFGKIEAFIIKGAIQGAAGNYLYAALQALSRMT